MHIHILGICGTFMGGIAAIAKAIVATGFKGYLAQEFVPTPKTKEGRAQSLAQAIRICDV